jgi:hypothetical protein
MQPHRPPKDFLQTADTKLFANHQPGCSLLKIKIQDVFSRAVIRAIQTALKLTQRQAG